MPTSEHRRLVCERVAQILKEEREKRGLSMTSLGERAGLSQQMVSYVERGMRIPGLDTLIRVTDALEIDLPEIIKRAMQADSENKKR